MVEKIISNKLFSILEKGNDVYIGNTSLCSIFHGDVGEMIAEYSGEVLDVYRAGEYMVIKKEGLNISVNNSMEITLLSGMFSNKQNNIFITYVKTESIYIVEKKIIDHEAKVSYVITYRYMIETGELQNVRVARQIGMTFEPNIYQMTYKMGKEIIRCRCQQETEKFIKEMLKRDENDPKKVKIMILRVLFNVKRYVERLQKK